MYTVGACATGATFGFNKYTRGFTFFYRFFCNSFSVKNYLVLKNTSFTQTPTRKITIFLHAGLNRHKSQKYFQCYTVLFLNF